jgi:MFS family permease
MPEGAAPGTSSEEAVRSDAIPTGSPLRIAHFRNLWLGSTVSLIGDQFYMVALPWLVLSLTGSGLALGTMMMAAAVPRAVLMLMGGAASDRFTPRSVLLTTTWTRTALVAIVAALAGLHLVQLWHLYFVSVIFGTADAFGIPAGQALLPSLVKRDQLTTANAMFSGSLQASSLLGPAPAGIVVSAWGVAAAFVVDAVSFLFAIVPLARLPKPEAHARDAHERPDVLRSIAEGLRYVWHDPALRSLVLIVAGLNLWATGPVMVGIPVLAKFRFGSSTAFGTLMSCFGGGALAGMTLAGTLKPRRRRGYLFLGFVCLESVGISFMPLIRSFPVLAVDMVLIGVCAGIANVSIIAWIQGRVDHALMGRVMSVVMFAAFGLMPISLVLAGLVADRHVTGMFIGAAGLIMLTAIVAGVSPATRHID